MPALNPAPQPNPDLQSLDQLIGTWRVSDEAEGEVRYEWMDGRCVMMQHFDLLHGGRRILGFEVIGHLQPLGVEPSPEIRTRVYRLLDGLTPDTCTSLKAILSRPGAARREVLPTTKALSAPTATRSRAAGYGPAAAIKPPRRGLGKAGRSAA